MSMVSREPSAPSPATLVICCTMSWGRCCVQAFMILASLHCSSDQCCQVVARLHGHIFQKPRPLEDISPPKFSHLRPVFWHFTTTGNWIFWLILWKVLHNDPTYSILKYNVPIVLFLTLVKMALLTPLCRMANTFKCPCSGSPPADPKLGSEDTNKMSKS